MEIFYGYFVRKAQTSLPARSIPTSHYEISPGMQGDRGGAWVGSVGGFRGWVPWVGSVGGFRNYNAIYFSYNAVYITLTP